MSDYTLYSQQVHVVLDPAAWDEAYFALLSLKHALAGVPGWKRLDILAHDRDDGTVHLRIISNWATVEQMETWLDSDLTVEGVLKSVTPPPRAIQVSFYEKIS